MTNTDLHSMVTTRLNNKIMDEGINSMVETIHQLEEENKKLKLAIKNEAIKLDDLLLGLDNENEKWFGDRDLWSKRSKDSHLRDIGMIIAAWKQAEKIKTNDPFGKRWQ